MKINSHFYQDNYFVFVLNDFFLFLIQNFYDKILKNYIKEKNYKWIINNSENTKIKEIDNFSISKNIIELIKIIPEKKHISYYEQKYLIIYNLLSSLQSHYNQCLIFYNEKRKEKKRR